MYKLILVDDEPSAIEAAKLVVEQDRRVAVVGEARSVPEAIRLVSEIHPNIAIVDIRLAGSSGLDLIDKMRESHLRPRRSSLPRIPNSHMRNEQ